MAIVTQDVILELNNVSKQFHDGELDITVLENINLTVNRADTIAVVGASGSGKSTLLQIMAGLDQTSQGQVMLAGHRLSQIAESKADHLRNNHLGFIYQFHHLLPEFTSLENVMMPLMVRHQSVAACRQQAITMLERVQLQDRIQHKPAELSGGERQRVAIARALVTQPQLILADEPTGNLDRKTAMQVFDLMLELNSENHTALIMVTHDISLAQRMAMQYELHDANLRQI